MKNHLFCFGLGYVAKELKTRLTSSFKVSGTHTTGKNLNDNEYLFNNENVFNTSLLEDVTHILISIPPNEDGDLVYLKLLEHIKKLKNLLWIGYLSSTSVYGDHQGNWVQENSKLNPNDYLGKNRIIAENQWLKSELPINILRLSGIYGKSRSTFDSIKSNRAIRIHKENHYFSRIYIKDLVSMIIKIMSFPKIGEIYNISDNTPSPNHEVVSFAYKLLNQSPPPLINIEDANLSEMMQHYYNSSKKVYNRKFKQDYNFELEFPSYKEGLTDIFKSI